MLVLLREPRGFKSIAQCVNSARHLLTGMGENTAEYMFYTLNTIRMYATAQRMFDAVVKPFLPGRKDLEPKVDVVFEPSEPLWEGDRDTFTVTAKITIPLGAHDKYRIFAFNWYATERFCVTTSGVFATSPSPELRSPTAPLDVP